MKSAGVGGEDLFEELISKLGIGCGGGGPL